MPTKRLKVVTIVGTRPEIIRLSRIIPTLDLYTNHILVHTGQNYDYELNEIFFKELGLRQPDYVLPTNTSTLGNMLGTTLIEIEKVFEKEKPDAVFILGDTNASIAAIIAKRMHIPIYHMEAGNRSFDNNVPEEINRKIIDHIADFNLVYTENSRNHLISEGLPHRRVYLCGSPMWEILSYYMSKIEKSKILTKLSLMSRNYFLVSMHREENVNCEDNLLKMIYALNTIAETYKLPVIVSTHPRTKKRIELATSKLSEPIHSLIQFLKPFGFMDYNQLQINAKCVISDSGTISEECAILKFPAITIRNSIERPESIDNGTIILTGLDSDTILNSVEIAIAERGEYPCVCEQYIIPNVSTRVLKLIVGTTKLHKQWSGLY